MSQVDRASQISTERTTGWPPAADSGPLLVPERLARVLRYFDGRQPEEALASLLAEQSLRLDPSLLRRLVDFEILKPAN